MFCLLILCYLLRSMFGFLVLVDCLLVVGVVVWLFCFVFTGLCLIALLW